MNICVPCFFTFHILLLVMILVSVIIPCYNSERYIVQSIESVIMQTFQQWEMIIVDDCSTDNSADIIKKYEAKDFRIRYLKTNEPSGSPSIPRNIGIREARGRYIAFLDSDDIWLPKKLEEQLKFIDQPNVAMVFSNFEKVDQAGRRTKRKIIAPSVVDYHLLLRGNCIGCLTVMYDTEKVGKMYFKNVRHEDCALWLSILKKGYKAQNTNSVMALYRVGNHSISSNKMKILSWQWNILRKEEKLPWGRAVFLYIHYAVKALLKAIK